MEDFKNELIKRSAVGTIFNELEKLKKSGRETMDKIRRRWIWELIQNASDCCPPGNQIDINVTFNGEDELTFQHNGRGFDNKSLWSIVTQISDKQVEEEKVGQFGTGFVTTSLLSPTIDIQSYIEGTNKGFSFRLDRTGGTREEIGLAVSRNIQSIENILASTFMGSIGITDTTFSYKLNDSEDIRQSIEAINEGVQSLLQNVYYILTFNAQIKSITYNGQKYTILQRKKTGNIGNLESVSIKNEHNDSITYVMNVWYENGSFAIPVENSSDLSFAPIQESVPRLYCKFPLVGTEDFPFPLVLNSEYFNVEIDRNAIFEGDPSNLTILANARKVYDEFLTKYSSGAAKQLYNICGFERNQNTNFKQQFANLLDSIIMYKPIIDTNHGRRISIRNENGDKQIQVPKVSKDEYKPDLWNLFATIPNMEIPTFNSFEGWRAMINNDFSLKDIMKTYFEDKTLIDIQNELGIQDLQTWLNKYYVLYTTVYEDKVERIQLPNQAGQFMPISKVKNGNQLIPQLLETLRITGDPLFGELIYPNVILPSELINRISILTNDTVAEIITKHVYVLLSSQHSEDRSEKTQQIFESLLTFFAKYPEEGQKYFPKIYEERSKLRSKDFAENLNQLGDLLSEKNISVQDVSMIFSNDQILTELLNNPQDLSDEVRQQLKHISFSSIYSKQKVDLMINRSIENTYRYLSKNPLYNIPSSFKEWKKSRLSTTIFPANKNDGEVFIVVRPSDDDKIIFYEDQELDVLDSNQVELWTDNGKTVRQLTLGDILKTTGITVIPLRNLF